MKKIITTLIIISLSIGNTFAVNYTLTPSDKLIVNKLSSKIQKILYSSSLQTRQTLENKVNEIQNQYKYNKKLFNIFEQIKINTHLISYKEEYNNHYKNYNIDFKKVKKYWLNLHNKARLDLGLSLYSYDDRLNNTTYEWSKTQQEKSKMTHERNPGDGFYNYHKIEKWFNDRGVKCKIAGGATSSESIGKFGYYCNDYDCTDELNKSLKTIFDIYMSEKLLKYPANAHYKGITLPELSKIGLGISIKERFDDTYSNYRSFDYYLTTHYCTEFKK